MEITGPDIILIASVLFLTAGAIAYHNGREDLGRVAGIVGFVGLAGLLFVLSYGYATSSRADRHLLIAVTGVAFLLSIQGIYLLHSRWERGDQLTTTVAAILLLLLPFEVYPMLQVMIQESLASQLVSILELLGYQATIVSRDGHMVELRFENNGFYYISRECTGIDGVAFFGGILVGARTSLRLKLAGFAFMVVAVYVVNMIRLVFVGSAMAGDWFGPLLTSEDTVQTTYYVAEVVIGQSAVVIASILGFLFVSRWIPDLTDFASALLDSFIEWRTAVNARLDAR